MANKNDEQILVVRSDILFDKGTWQGLKTDNLDYYIDLIKKNCEFKRRGDVETDSSFQQIIPYMLFSTEGGSVSAGSIKFFAYRYLSNAGEKRLINDKYQVGVGGHIELVDNEDDGKDILESGMMREWKEEVDFKGNILEKKLVGILNDDTNPVEEVHLGLVYHFKGDSDDIKIKEIDKLEGQLFSLKEIKEDISHSPWMNVVYKDYLLKIKND